MNNHTTNTPVIDLDTLPRAIGVSRDAEWPKAMLVFFERPLSDDEMRGLHEVLGRQQPPVSGKMDGLPPMPKRWQDRSSEHPADTSPDYLIELEMKEWREWGAKVAQQAAPEAQTGYKLVPIEPTAEMWEAWGAAEPKFISSRVLPDGTKAETWISKKGTGWDAMLAAAPATHQATLAAPAEPAAWIAWYDGVKSQNVARTPAEKAEIENIARLMGYEATLTWEELYSRAPASPPKPAASQQAVAANMCNLCASSGVVFNESQNLNINDPAATTASASEPKPCQCGICATYRVNASQGRAAQASHAGAVSK
jgi:hypothetical protein